MNDIIHQHYHATLYASIFVLGCYKQRMQSITQLEQLRRTVVSWRTEGKAIALVPTMGALHDGHLKLVEEAKKHADRVVVSIFVNPTQFGPNEDFSRYPRPIERDLELLISAGASAAWLPIMDEMYPEGFASSIHISGITEMLDGVFRPGHFDGVATVVTKLLLQVTPNIALFGEKDYQQLCLIKRLVKDLNINTSILGVSTVRELDGLALSSRNQYLSAEQRPIAAQIYATMKDAGAKLKSSPKDVAAILESAKGKLLVAGFTKIDYLELRAEDSLAAMDHYKAPARLLIAAWLGTTRLIDNIKVG
jgi:pantoate--beta-alanine ligase